jgi:hypothetical protein
MHGTLVSLPPLYLNIFGIVYLRTCGKIFRSLVNRERPPTNADRLKFRTVRFARHASLSTAGTTPALPHLTAPQNLRPIPLPGSDAGCRRGAGSGMRARASTMRSRISTRPYPIPHFILLSDTFITGDAQTRSSEHAYTGETLVVRELTHARR